MTLDSILRYAATGSAAVAAVIISVPHLLDPGLALAQPAQSLRQRLNTPGTAFVAEIPAKLASMQDVGTGRRFRGKMNEMMWFRAAIRTPGANATLQRVALHFHSDGPSLRTVDVMDGNVRAFHLEIPSLTGDYTRVEGNNNMWTFPPYRVRGQLGVRLQVSYPTGFDSVIDPGAFLITSVGADFARTLSDTVTTRGRN